MKFAAVMMCKEKHGSMKRERRYKCGSCAYTAYTRSILQRHEARHAPCRRPQYRCDVCGARLMTVYSLNEHKRLSHVDDRPFPCAICGFTAKCQYLSLTVSQSSSSYSSPPVCSLYLLCSGRFPREPGLAGYPFVFRVLVLEKTLCKCVTGVYRLDVLAVTLAECQSTEGNTKH